MTYSEATLSGRSVREALRGVALALRAPVFSARILERFRDLEAGAEPVPSPPKIQRIVDKTYSILYMLLYFGAGKDVLLNAVDNIIEEEAADRPMLGPFIQGMAYDVLVTAPLDNRELMATIMAPPTWLIDELWLNLAECECDLSDVGDDLPYDLASPPSLNLRCGGRVIPVQ